MTPNSGPVVIDACAVGGCGPQPEPSTTGCTLETCTLETVANEYAEASVTFCKLHSDVAPDVVEALGIRCFPTLLLCLDGQVIDAVVGRFDAKSVRKRVDWLLRQTERQGLFARIFWGRRTTA